MPGLHDDWNAWPVRLPSDFDKIAALARIKADTNALIQERDRLAAAAKAAGPPAYLRQARVLANISEERIQQDEKWGEQTHPDGTGDAFRAGVADRYKRACDAALAAGTVTWLDIFLEEVFEAAAESDPARLRAELIQALAVGVNWIEDIDAKAAR